MTALDLTTVDAAPAEATVGPSGAGRCAGCCAIRSP